jgi:hypothetical protein
MNPNLNNPILSFSGKVVKNFINFLSKNTRLLFILLFFGQNIVNSHAQVDCCDVGEKVKTMVLKYTGQDCSASNNNQGPIGNKWNCSGNPNGDQQVYIVVNDQNGTNYGGTIYFAGTVNINAQFTAIAATEFKANSYVHILNQQGGSQIQLLQIHTSCSVPIVSGDQFGSIILISSTYTNGYNCAPADPCVIFKPTITGTDLICSDNVVPTDLTAGGGVSYIWNTGATTATITVNPTVTTTYTVTVTSSDGCIKPVSKTVNVGPCSGQICFNGNNNVSATANWTITYTTDPANNKVKIRATLSKNFVDNTYGTNAIGWPDGHAFDKLVGSDHLILSMLDGNNTKKMEVKMDYISASGAAPSGYKSLGVTGGDGSQ